MKTLKLTFLIAIATFLSSYCFGQWNQLDLSGTTWKLEDIYCTDKDTCFVVGPDGYILKTTDGGTNWTQLTSGTTNWLTGVYFMSSNTGIVVGDNIILKTTNAGANWTPKPHPIAAPMNIFFYNDTLGYAGDAGGGDYLKTIDGGETWNWGGILGPGGPVNGICFINENTGYMVEYFIPDNRIWKTNNGGSSWTQIFTYSEELKDVFFTNDSIGYVVGYSGTILKTTDAGNSWDTLTSGTSEGLNSVYCVDADTCYVVGEDIILKTTDAGNTWNIQSITPPPAGLYSLYAVFFPSASIGYAVGRQANAYALKIGGGVGIADISKGENLISIYPNPLRRDGLLNIAMRNFKPNNNSCFKIYDIIGKEIKQVNIQSTLTRVDVSNLKSGLYTYILTGSDGIVSVGKIILQ